MTNVFQQKKYWCVLGVAVAVICMAVPAYAYRERPSDRIERSCGEMNAGKKILVAYDTEHGTTAALADKITEVLCEEGYQVDLKLARKVYSVSEYDGFVFGTPIYLGAWLPELKRMLWWHQKAISAKPHALFVNCTYLKEDTEAIRSYISSNWVKPTLDKYSYLNPSSIGLLPGEFTFKELYPMELFLMKLAKYEDRDWVDLNKVGEWALTLKAVFN